jgi:hypothetical protein
MDIKFPLNSGEVFLGRVTLKDGVLVCSDFPFFEKSLFVGKENLLLRLVAYSNLDEVVLFIIDAIFEDISCHTFLKVSSSSISSGEFDLVTDLNPKHIVEMFIQELSEYSMSGDINYAEMFQKYFHSDM